MFLPIFHPKILNSGTCWCIQCFGLEILHLESVGDKELHLSFRIKMRNSWVWVDNLHKSIESKETNSVLERSWILLCSGQGSAWSVSVQHGRGGTQPCSWHKVNVPRPVGSRPEQHWYEKSRQQKLWHRTPAMGKEPGHVLSRHWHLGSQKYIPKNWSAVEAVQGRTLSRGLLQSGLQCRRY